MENTDISIWEPIITVIAIPLVNFATARLKQKTSWTGEVSLLVVCIALGLVYAVFHFLLPEAMKQSILSFAAVVGFAAMFLYEFLKARGKLPKSFG